MAALQLLHAQNPDQYSNGYLNLAITSSAHNAKAFDLLSLS
jgi:hypothetical protein